MGSDFLSLRSVSGKNLGQEYMNNNRYVWALLITLLADKIFEGMKTVH